MSQDDDKPLFFPRHSNPDSLRQSKEGIESVLVSNNFARLNPQANNDDEPLLVTFAAADTDDDSHHEGSDGTPTTDLPVGLLRLPLPKESRARLSSKKNSTSSSGTHTPAFSPAASSGGGPVISLVASGGGSPILTSARSRNASAIAPAEGAKLPRASVVGDDDGGPQTQSRVGSVLSVGDANETDVPFITPGQFAPRYSDAQETVDSESRTELPRMRPYNGGRVLNYYSRSITSDNTTLAPHRTFTNEVIRALYHYLERASKEIQDLSLRKAIENGVYDRLGVVSSSSHLMGKKFNRKNHTFLSAINAAGDTEESSDEEEEDPIVALMARTDFPLKDKYNEFNFPPAWFRAMEPPSEAQQPGEIPWEVRGRVLATVTELPPVYYLGMLLDPQSNRFLFQGSAFLQEARVFTVNLSDVGSENSSLNSYATSRKTGAATVAAQGKFLVREYFSVSKLNEGCCVQTFSPLPLDTNPAFIKGKHYIISPEVAETLLGKTLPGAFTRAFSLFNVVARVETTPDEETELDMVHSFSSVNRKDLNSSFGSFARKKSLTSLSGMNALFFPRKSVEATTALNPIQKSIMKKLMPSEARKVEPRKPKRDPLAEELLLRDTHPALFDWAMSHSLEELKAPIDHIRDYLIYHRQTYSYRMLRHSFMRAVRCIQRFFRRCLAHKRRALQRMLRLWRQLEVECRARLQHYRPPPSAKERVELIASGVLIEQLVTTKEYKIKLIREMWQQRAEALHRWVGRQRTRDRISRYVRSASEYEESMRKKSVSISNQALPYKEVLQRLPSRMEVSMSTCYNPHHQSPGDARSDTKAGTSLRPEPPAKKSIQWHGAGKVKPSSGASKCTAGALRASMLDKIASQVTARKAREDEEMYERFGWFIKPEVLLYESHKRLLSSLKTSVLDIEQVQHEFMRVAGANTINNNTINNNNKSASQ